MFNKLTIFFLIFSGCTNIKISSIINNELIFNYKAQVNLYSINNRKIPIKKFYKFSYHEHLARDNINQLCLDYIVINKLKDIKCIYMGTTHTEKIITSLN